MATPLQRRTPLKVGLPDVIYGFAQDNWLAADFARECGAEYRSITAHTFPDGESKVTVPGGAGHALVCRAFENPNRTLIEVLLAASALRDQGAKTITLAAPYLAYMRQDKAFHTGEAVSQRVIGGLLADAFDRFIAVDPHLHRVKSLTEVFKGKSACALTAAPLMAEHFARRKLGRNTVAVGPDIESRPLVSAFARVAGIEWIAASKSRRGDRDVELALPAGIKVDGRPAVIVDDIVSSGTTVARLSRMLKSHGVTRVDVYTTHALFDEKVQRELKRAGVDHLFSCDGVAHPTNAISLAPLLMQGLKEWL